MLSITWNWPCPRSDPRSSNGGLGRICTSCNGSSGGWVEGRACHTPHTLSRPLELPRSLRCRFSGPWTLSATATGGRSQESSWWTQPREIGVAGTGPSWRVFGEQRTLKTEPRYQGGQDRSLRQTPLQWLFSWNGVVGNKLFWLINWITFKWSITKCVTDYLPVLKDQKSQATYQGQVKCWGKRLQNNHQRRTSRPALGSVTTHFLGDEVVTSFPDKDRPAEFHQDCCWQPYIWTFQSFLFLSSSLSQFYFGLAEGFVEFGTRNLSIKNPHKRLLKDIFCNLLYFRSDKTKA